jgi:hypothetical protein
MRVGNRRTGLIGWAVIATFARTDSGEVACIEYRVRTIGGCGTVEDSAREARRVQRQMIEEAPSDSVESRPIPVAGIPRYVFEVASQTRLLAQARDALSTRPNTVPPLSAEAKDLLRPEARRIGRPPARSIAAKLTVLADVQAAHASGESLDAVATRHHMSRSSLRDLLYWARHTAQPRLFTSLRPGVRGGELTADAKAMLAEMAD